MFLHSLEGPATARTEANLNLFYARYVKDSVGQKSRSTASIVSTVTIRLILDPDQEVDAWKVLRAELMSEGILPSLVAIHKTEIIMHMKRLVLDDEAEGSLGLTDRKEEEH
jgi:hypothetical protein